MSRNDRNAQSPVQPHRSWPAIVLALPLACLAPAAHAEGCAQGELSSRFPSLSGTTLKVAIDPNEPPMIFRDPTDPSLIDGLHADLMRAVARCLGASVDFQVLDFNGLIPAVTSGRADIQFTGMYYKPARAEVVDYVDYLRGVTGGLVAKGDAAAIKGLDDLCGRHGAVMTGSVDDVTLRDQSEKCVAAGKPPVAISAFPNTAAMVRAVQNRRVDLCMTESAVVRQQAHDNPSTFEEAFSIPTDLEIGASVAKSNAVLRDAVLASLTLLQQRGEQDALLRRYGLDPLMTVPARLRTE